MARFIGRAATRQAIEQAAWDDYEGDREEECP